MTIAASNEIGSQSGDSAHGTASRHASCKATSLRGWFWFGLSTAVMVSVWTMLLPWIGTHRHVRARIDRLDARGIDPSALYYTDLDVMTEIEAEMTARRRKHPEAFWPAR